MIWPEPIGSGHRRAPSVEDEVSDLSAPAAPSTTPLFDSTQGRADTAGAPPSAASGKMPRLPYGVVTSWPLRFHGDARVYARLCARNLLWVVLTLGLYLPWARASSQRYLMRHTKVAGHALDYHEPGERILPRFLLALSLCVGVAGAWAGGSRLMGMLALSTALAVWPLLVYLSLTHRLAHLSWAHRRLAFDGEVQEVYRAMWTPLAGGGLVAWLLMVALTVHHPGSWLAWGVALALWLLAMPAFVWTWYLFRQRHLRLGPLHLLWKASRPAVAMVFLRTLVWAMLATILSMGLGAMLVAAVLAWRGRLDVSMGRVVLAFVALAVCAAVQPYAQVRLQNLVWSKSGNRYLRFRSKLSVSGYVALQCRHAVLMVLTLGLYWPWAVIESRRMRVTAMTVWSRVDADVLKAHWPIYQPPLVGKMAGSPAHLQSVPDPCP
jgi:uncharacterized membrane protein YjgN (DUF898 family)